LGNVFDAFVQTTSGQQSHQGTGLGMPISQQFVRMMGGDITVSSEVGKGSVFTFDIPVEIVEAAKVPTAQPAHRVIGLETGQPVFRILIVEDEEANRRLLLKLLRPFGFDIREATNGQDAIAIWQTWQPHLIWMDIRMPVMDGYTATREIRKAEDKKKEGEKLRKWEGEKGTLQSTIIIALTASAFKEQRTEALESGCDDFVHKPLNEQEIFGMMRKHLGVRFIYEEGERQKVKDERQKAEAVLTPEALAALPAEWLECLEQGAQRADFLLLSKVIAQIRAQDAKLADALAQLAEDFEYDKMLALMRVEVLTPASLATLSPTLVEKLRQTVGSLDIAGTKRIIAQIRPDNESLAAALARLAEDFQYDEILAFIEKINRFGVDTT
jgi:CheY-like chemotaxis protein